jgi:6-phosphogluconolactonase
MDFPHHSISRVFAELDAATGQLTALGHVATEAVPSAFGLDPAGQFVAAAGTATGRLAMYCIQGETGTLTPLATYAVGQRPMGVLITRVGD